MTSSPISKATKAISPAVTRLILIADLKREIKELEAEMKKEVEFLEKEILLGLLDEYADGDSFIYDGIKCTPVVTFRWQYDEETKARIKQLQEFSQLSASAFRKSTTSLRFTF
nr:hypothetical protein [uncultured Mediterranean phage uvMED]